MARPRSIGGLLFRLAALHARRRPGWLVVLACVVVAAVAWPRHGADGSGPGGLQVGVLRDGFVFTHLGDDGRRVVELDVAGHARRTLMVPQRDDRRVVGTSVGTAIGWQDGQKIRVARVEDGADLGSWGKAARQLCDGVASNDKRFAVGWLESDESVWIVHGPVAETHVADAGEPTAGRALAGEAAVPSNALARTDWCGVASAEDNVALLWRSADRLRFTMCSSKRCSTLSAAFAFDRRLPLLGFGCLRNACLVASRDAAGNARIAFLTQTSRTKWTRPLTTASSSVSIVGVGDHAFALGHATSDGTEVVRVDREGAITPLWRGPISTTAPALAWSSGRLLIARPSGDTILHDIIELAW